jgi:hypothetical protein
MIYLVRKSQRVKTRKNSCKIFLENEDLIKQTSLFDTDNLDSKNLK